MTTKPLAIAAALTLTLGSAIATVTPAYAATESRQIEVSYADLNLETDAGRATLERRLDKAARNVCDADSSAIGRRIAPRQETECLAKARSLATEQVARIMQREALGG